MTAHNLVEYLEATADRWPERPAVVDPDGTPMTYRELNQQSQRFAAFLVERGIQPADRVAIALPKTTAALVAMFGTMKAGAAYVPVDVFSPADRGHQILTDCEVRVFVVDSQRMDLIPDPRRLALAALIVAGSPGAAAPVPSVALEAVLSDDRSTPTRKAARNGLAYILYTSGSTGIPKGVPLTHENALSFIEWASSVFTPTETDRFSSHAPLYFDLSVLDVYLSVKHGATLYLISEELGRNPKEVARFIAANQLTIWYSTPSILAWLVQFGDLAANPMHLRLVLFAGEVFPVKHLRRLKTLWPVPTYYNLYGPTETNVCTFARIPDVIPADRAAAYPIGVPCAHCRALVLDEERREVVPGEEGLLYISGPSLFDGYWNRPAENAAAFLERDGVRWYNTGDLVKWSPDEGFLYLGRKDRMVKRRGYRIELGELERALLQHSDVREAAVVAVPDEDAGNRLVAFLSCGAAARPSIVALKTFCRDHLPGYMSPDQFVIQEALPKTPTAKTDYRALGEIARSAARPSVGR